MRIVTKTTWVVAGLALLVWTIQVSGQPTTGATGHAPLPAALDSLYPPVAPAPVYLIKMHEMATPLSGIVSDAMEGDLANAKANFDAFRQKYTEVSELVPAWKSMFPMAPLDQLKAALEAGTPDNIMPAMGAIGEVCNACHHTYMPMAQHRYHWDDFGRITVTDPLSGQDVPFTQYMHMVESDMTGVGVDLQQGQIDQARQHAKGFRARMATLKEACGACHDTERHYYVDNSIFAMIDELDKGLAEAQPSMPAVGGTLQKIGMESCFKCHLVHIPAAYAK